MKTSTQHQKKTKKKKQRKTLTFFAILDTQKYTKMYLRDKKVDFAYVPIKDDVQC